MTTPRTLLLAACLACKPTPVATPEPATPPTPAEPTPEPVAAPAPAQAPAQFPDTVFAAHPVEAQWTVDMIDFAGADITALERRAQAAPEGTILEFEPGDPSLPAGFALGDPWTLITRDGPDPRTVQRFSAAIYGSGALHFDVHLGPAAKGAKGPVIAVRGHAPTTAKLVSPPPVRPSTLAKDTLKKTVAAIDPHLEPELREVLPTIKFTDAHLKLYPGRFPGGRSHIGFLAATARGEENATLPVSGLVFAWPDGRVEFFATAVTWGTATFVALVDLDGDGLDEVLYDDTYFEGAYVQLLHWKEGRPFARTLTGDGL
jgi:hypothetical protein